MSDASMPKQLHPFRPEEFGFFLREDWKMQDILFFEKKHDSINERFEKDWLRINLFLSKSGHYFCIWYGVIDPAMADMAYEEKLGFIWSDYNEDEFLFRGYINNKQEAEIILRAIRIDKYGPQYVGK